MCKLGVQNSEGVTIVRSDARGYWEDEEGYKCEREAQRGNGREENRMRVSKVANGEAMCGSYTSYERRMRSIEQRGFYKLRQTYGRQRKVWEGGGVAGVSYACLRCRVPA